jgi:hypothetical protein
MALPTHGRVIVNTTAGELDIELWSRVRHARMHPALRYEQGNRFAGSPEGVQEFSRSGHGG